MKYIVPKYILLVAAVIVISAEGNALAEEDRPDGTSPSGDTVDAGEAIEDIETILTEPLSKEAYVKSERCVSKFKFSSVEIIDKQHILFYGRRGKTWLNKMRQPCIGLSRHDIPQFDYRIVNKLCSLDSFTGVILGFSGARRSSATCVLGEFHPVSREQVILIKESIRRKARRRN